KARVLAEAM
nr:Chain E, substrate CA-p2 [Human immunodeficiency virus 1]